MPIAKRRQREISRIRADILEAAARAFARAGFRRATMQDIAREAGYTAASLYTYFRSKKEISEQLARALTAEYVRTFAEPLPAGLTFDQKLEMVVARQLEMADRRRDVFVSLFTLQEGGASDDCSRRSFHRNFEERIGSLTDWLRQHAAAEDIGGHDPDLVARFLVGFAFALLHRWISVGPRERLVDRARLILDFFFNGVRGGSKAPRKGEP